METLRVKIRDVPFFGQAIGALAEPWRTEQIHKVVGIESRGFIFASALAYELGTGLAIVRKPGKLPYRTIQESYTLEYGQDTLELHDDAIASGERVLVVDDLLATGGTAGAVGRMIGRQGGHLVGYGFLIELGFLDGMKRLACDKVHTVIRYAAP